MARRQNAGLINMVTALGWMPKQTLFTPGTDMYKRGQLYDCNAYYAYSIGPRLGTNALTLLSSLGSI